MEQEPLSINPIGGNEDMTASLQLYQTVPFHVDNVYPYNPSRLKPHVLPNPYHVGNAVHLEAQSFTDRMALHLSPAAQSGLYTISNQADACISWRVLSDRRTLELQPLRWVTSPEPPTPGKTRSILGKAANTLQEFEASRIGLYVFPAPLLPNVVILDEAQSGHVIIMACTETGIVYRLTFLSAWAVANEEWSPDMGASYYAIERYKGRGGALVSGRNPVGFCAVNGNVGSVACADGSLTLLIGFVTPEEQRGDLKGFIDETTLSPNSVLSSVKQLLPRMLGRNASSEQYFGASQPITMTVSTLYGGQVRFGITLDSERRLRFWSFSGQPGCMHTEQLPVLDQRGQQISHNSEQQAPPSLDLRVRHYIRSLWLGNNSDEQGQFTVAIYVPDTSTPYFALLEGKISPNNKLQRINTLMRRTCRAVHGASQLMIGDELIDFQVVHRESTVSPSPYLAEDDGSGADNASSGVDDTNNIWTLWALWERDQESIITYTYFTLRADNASGQAIEYDGDQYFGERWYLVIKEFGASRPVAVGSEINSLDFHSGEDIDGQSLSALKSGNRNINSANLAGRLASEITGAFMSHLFDPLRFDRGVLAHSLALYEQSVKDRGFNLSSSSASSTPLMASSPNLYSRAASTIGSFLRVEVSREDGSLLISDYRRALHTEWMRYATLCSRLQRAANAPSSLALCPATQMLTVVRGNGLAPLQTAGEVEWMRAVSDNDPAALAVLSAPSSLLFKSYPVLASRMPVPKSLGFYLPLHMYLEPWGSDCVAFFTRKASLVLSNPLYVALDVALVELFESLELGTNSWNIAHVRRTMRLLRACRAPNQTIAQVLRALIYSTLPRPRELYILYTWDRYKWAYC